MPLLPPAQLFEHPADLVIDVFGTFLGKRSERMVVRWRDTDAVAPAIPSAACRDSTTDDSGPADSASVASQIPIEKPVESHGNSARLARTADSSEFEASESTIPSKAKELDSDNDSNHSSADQITAQLLQIWKSETPRALSTPSRPASLKEQLDEIAETTGESPSSGIWKERAVPMSRLRSVTVSGRGVTVSSDLINALVERGIALSFLSGRGQPIAQLIAAGLSGTVQTRRSQLAAYDTALGVQLAVEFIRGKLRNQKHQLQYSGKYLKSTDLERFDRLNKKVKAISALRKQLIDFTADKLDDVRDKLMGYEGSAARLYWEGVAILLEGRAEFSGRVTRGAIDPINSALNYGYGILYGQVSSAVANAGLELFAGFLHVDRPGKPALVLDLVEEFRAPVVDRAILAIVNQGIAIETDSHGLVASSRKLVADRVLERLSTAVPYEGKRWPLRNVIQTQARHLAVAVRGEREYRAFASRW